MDEIRDEIRKKVDNLTDYECKEILKNIEWLLVPDPLSPFLADKKIKIYKKYADTIADLVAKIEVYDHDLPRQIAGMVEILFTLLSSASDEVNETEEAKWYDLMIGHVYFLEDYLYLYLGKLYLKKIREYRKVLKNFKHKQIQVENEFFMEMLNRELAKNVRAYKENRSHFGKRYGVHFLEMKMLMGELLFAEKFMNKNMQVNINSSTPALNLKIMYEGIKKLLETCEGKYPEIINNGYDDSVGRKVWDGLLTLVPLGLAIYGFVQLI